MDLARALLLSSNLDPFVAIDDVIGNHRLILCSPWVVTAVISDGVNSVFQIGNKATIDGAVRPSR